MDRCRDCQDSSNGDPPYTAEESLEVSKQASCFAWKTAGHAIPAQQAHIIHLPVCCRNKRCCFVAALGQAQLCPHTCLHG
jgi:hypothetical protein